MNPSRGADHPLARKNDPWAMRPYETLGGYIMKVHGFRLIAQTAILTIVFSAGGQAADSSEPGVAKQSLQAKIEYCKTCHGLSGEGYRGYYAMPRLAGQQPKYIENQLRAFAERRRVSPEAREREKTGGPEGIMFNVSHVLSPPVFAALAAHLKALDPPPLGGAPKDQLSLGKKIYEDGLPETNVPACSACHGPEAKGREEIPRLAGQVFPYTVQELRYWSKERGQGAANDDVSAIMIPTTHNLTPSQIAALAAYLAYLK
jgi:cytochrome c553